ncbi:hypothetical protein EVAR_21026_1 [Eumeta japonica]|uniref:Uncharacterized protein n=1 Tax=Eumeta variegata TaxID=151549 RepID=A0A4C1UZR1_EUMVA|nr:hypothetical protein EVAR_21026_1 [Eumeta japonica]
MTVGSPSTRYGYYERLQTYRPVSLEAGGRSSLQGVDRQLSNQLLDFPQSRQPDSLLTLVDTAAPRVFALEAGVTWPTKALELRICVTTPPGSEPDRIKGPANLILIRDKGAEESSLNLSALKGRSSHAGLRIPVTASIGRHEMRSSSDICCRDN